MGVSRRALIIGRGQPFHKGHVKLIRRALEECDELDFGLGSTQISGEVRHPFTSEQRIDMLWTILKDDIQRVRIHPLVDVNSMDDTDDWVRYVLGKIHKQKRPEPTDYYTGSMADAKWYFNAFAGPGDEVIESGDETIYVRGDKRLHIVDRTMSGYPPAEELRSLIERRDPDWKPFVPEEIHEMVESGYPAKLRVALRGTQFPDDPPEGLGFIREDMIPPKRWEFRRGRWIEVRTENASRFR